MTEIQKVKAEIKMLEKKLSFLEELEKTKSPVEEAYKDCWGEYPGTENWTSDATRWQGFQAGYEFAYAISTAKEVMEKVQEEQEEDEWKSVALRFGEKLSGYLSDGYYELSPSAWFRWAVFTYGKGQQIKDAVRESVKWCEEHPDENPLDWVKPQTPEQVADGLKEAFREAVKQGIVSSVDEPTKPMNEVLDRLENKYENDDVVNRMLKKWEENPPDFLRFELGKSLEALITRWWDDVYDGIHQDWDREVAIDDLIDQIQLWLPKSQSSSGTQSASVIDLVDGYNDALTKIKSKLRNKK